VPTFYAALLRAELPVDTFASTRACVSAGEPLPADLHGAWRARFGVEIVEGLGATGRLVPGTEVELRNADGAPAADGEQGVLWVKTPSAAMGYWKRLDHSRRTFVGEWLRTGDVCRRDPDGFYVHCGREDDFFKVAGQWVAPGALEAVARRHPDVLEAAAVGAEDGGGLIKPFVFVVPRQAAVEPGILEADVRRLLEASLPRHQWPLGILVVAELPRTATGKVQRHRLRERVARSREADRSVRAPGRLAPPSSDPGPGAAPTRGGTR